MNPFKRIKIRKGLILFPSLSIRLRLPLLICILLLCVIVIFSWIAYLGMKKSALEAGRHRLQTLTEQLSAMFRQSAERLEKTTREAAEEKAIIQFLLSGGTDSLASARHTLQQLGKDTSTPLVELLDIYGTSIVRTGNEKVKVRLTPNLTMSGSETARIGKIYTVNDSMYYPVIASVVHNKRPVGYVVRWRKLQATPRALKQLSQLIGSKATLYFGNTDGRFWTDMIRPVSYLPVYQPDKRNLMEYSLPGKGQLLATVRPVPNTGWLIWLEFSRDNILVTARSFLYWIIGVGALLVLAGILIAWLVSRNITWPLDKLTKAATAIAKGDYTIQVEENRHDELGQLAHAFNSMSGQVQQSQHDLERKVEERTAQLETVNKELEAFSYSVSHDLRAPLRAINGYSIILKEDYGPALDEEANRLINTVIANAGMMGQLIDDLIAFSKISKKEMVMHPVDMKSLAELCLAEFLDVDKTKKYKVQVNALPSCYGDRSMIKQVWCNLVSNAIKYSSRKADPCIEIGYKENGKGNIYYVRDNGVGFDMQYYHKLFGVFQRLHSPETFEGTGVGLALAKRIVTKHGGEIWAESLAGKGATFFFSIPKNTS